jgi:hypothetical protein
LRTERGLRVERGQRVERGHRAEPTDPQPVGDNTSDLETE